jgi:hypothetical protein
MRSWRARAGVRRVVPRRVILRRVIARRVGAARVVDRLQRTEQAAVVARRRAAPTLVARRRDQRPLRIGGRRRMRGDELGERGVVVDESLAPGLHRRESRRVGARAFLQSRDRRGDRRGNHLAHKSDDIKHQPSAALVTLESAQDDERIGKALGQVERGEMSRVQRRQRGAERLQVVHFALALRFRARRRRRGVAGLRVMRHDFRGADRRSKRALL